MKKLILLLAIAFILYSFNTLVTLSSSIPPGGYNGEFGFYCNACHSSYGLNSGGGSVFLTGFPVNGYIPGQTYPFSITITHGTPDRTRWGFEIAARNQLGQPVGEFNPGPNNYLISPAQLGHFGAVFTDPTDRYNYFGMSWTAPAAPTPDDVMVNFYLVGNAANGNGGNDGDYIYSNTVLFVLPVHLGYFNAKVIAGYKTALEWQTIQETNTAFFVIERSIDGLSFTPIDSVAAAGNSSVPRAYHYIDAAPRVFDQTVFYRLKQTDLNSHFMYSTIARVVIKNTGTFIKNIVPNPAMAGQPFYAQVQSKTAQQVAVTLNNLQGKTVFSQTSQLQEGFNTIAFNPLLYIPAGHYFLTMQNSRFCQRIGIMVQ